jgi:tRNA-splicing ligase RtcB
MNTRKLEKLGVPHDCVKTAIAGMQSALSRGVLTSKAAKERLRLVVANPNIFVGDEDFGPLASALIEHATPIEPNTIDYPTWGDEIDEESKRQMRDACSLPMARAAALMPDAHVGYGLPIGGVLALENAVIPYGVGVDIACRMKLSVLDLPVETMESKFKLYHDALEKGTRFGIGVEHKPPRDHAVMDQDWNVSRITREKKDLAWRQLGTSGSGNHFVEFGRVTFAQPHLGLEAGEYVGLLSHSGSRGTGSAVCDTYSNIARARMSSKHAHFGRLAWLDLSTPEGQDYWAAMNLMGDYASANHDVIHKMVTKLLGAKILGGVENHHNFAWKETHGGRELIVHRKGATPAGAGELGVIPGSMGSPSFVVMGKGNPESLASASHGAGRRMSRTKAKEQFSWKSVQRDLAARGIQVLSAAADEVPGVYKDIESVMAAQSDLVAIIGRFDPKIVKMSPGGKPED